MSDNGSANPDAKTPVWAGRDLRREVFDQLGSMSSSDLQLLDLYLQEEKEAYRRKSASWSATSVLGVLSAVAIVGLLAAYGAGAIGMPFDVLVCVMLGSMLIAFLLWALQVRSDSERRIAEMLRDLPSMRREEKLRLYARLQVEEQEAEGWSLKHRGIRL